MKRIYVIVGPSGSGKTSLGLYMETLGIVKLVTCTNRPRRTGETDGKDYYFVNDAFFESENFLEKVDYAGTKRGLLKCEIDRKLAMSDKVYALMDSNGLQAMKKEYGSMVLSIGLKTDWDTCYRHMMERGDRPQDIERRKTWFEKNQEADLWKQTDVWIDATGTKEEMFRSFDSIRMKNGV